MEKYRFWRKTPANLKYTSPNILACQNGTPYPVPDARQRCRDSISGHTIQEQRKENMLGLLGTVQAPCVITSSEMTKRRCSITPRTFYPTEPDKGLITKTPNFNIEIDRKNPNNV